MLTNFSSEISGFSLCHFVWVAMLLLFVCGSTSLYGWFHSRKGD
jgi:hypothetical protein